MHAYLYLTLPQVTGLWAPAKINTYRHTPPRPFLTTTAKYTQFLYSPYSNGNTLFVISYTIFWLRTSAHAGFFPSLQWEIQTILSTHVCYTTTTTRTYCFSAKLIRNMAVKCSLMTSFIKAQMSDHKMDFGHHSSEQSQSCRCPSVRHTRELWQNERWLQHENWPTAGAQCEW